MGMRTDRVEDSWSGIVPIARQRVAKLATRAAPVGCKRAQWRGWNPSYDDAVFHVKEAAA